MGSDQDQAAAAMRASLWVALTRPSGGATTHQAILDIASASRRLFFEVALALLDSLPRSALRARAGRRLFECPEFLLELFAAGRFSDEELGRRCSEWIEIDRFLDMHLARLLPGRNEDSYRLPAETIARILDILNRISSGPRLVLMLNHLKNHPDPRIAERATVVVGRRISSERWVKQCLASTDPRIRAAAVEGLWGRNTESARDLLWQYQADENNRVAGNVLLGLHFLGESRVPELVRDMIHDSRPAFRGTAAWVMGQIGNREYIEALREALADPDAAVHAAALKALGILRRSLPPEEFANQTKPLPNAVEPVESAPPPEAQPKRRDLSFRFRFDGSFNRGSEEDPESSDEADEDE